MPATPWDKLCLRRIKTHEIALFCVGCIRYYARDILLDGRYLLNRSMDLGPVCQRLLGLILAFQRYKVPLCRIRTQEMDVFSGEDLSSCPWDILLDGRLLDNGQIDLPALSGGCWASAKKLDFASTRI